MHTCDCPVAPFLEYTATPAVSPISFVCFLFSASPLDDLSFSLWCLSQWCLTTEHAGAFIHPCPPCWLSPFHAWACVSHDALLPLVFTQYISPSVTLCTGSIQCLCAGTKFMALSQAWKATPETGCFYYKVLAFVTPTPQDICSVSQWCSRYLTRSLPITPTEISQRHCAHGFLPFLDILCWALGSTNGTTIPLAMQDEHEQIIGTPSFSSPTTIKFCVLTLMVNHGPPTSHLYH